MDSATLIASLQRQLEWYLSEPNLSTDVYLRSQMDNDQYVPIDIIANFNQVKKLTTNKDLVIEALRKSQIVEVDEAGVKVRPVSVDKHRTTIILREIAPEDQRDKIEELFANFSNVSCEFIFNNSWYVHFQSFDPDEEAQRAYRYLREEVQTFQGKPIMARIKAKPTPGPIHGLSSSYVSGHHHAAAHHHVPQQQQQQQQQQQVATAAALDASVNPQLDVPQQQQQQQQQMPPPQAIEQAQQQVQPTQPPPQPVSAAPIVVQPIYAPVTTASQSQAQQIIYSPETAVPGTAVGFTQAFPFYPPPLLQAWAPANTACAYDLSQVIKFNGLSPQVTFKPQYPPVETTVNREQRPANGGTHHRTSGYQGSAPRGRKNYQGSNHRNVNGQQYVTVAQPMAVPVQHSFPMQQSPVLVAPQQVVPVSMAEVSHQPMHNVVASSHTVTDISPEVSAASNIMIVCNGISNCSISGTTSTTTTHQTTAHQAPLQPTPPASTAVKPTTTQPHLSHQQPQQQPVPQLSQPLVQHKPVENGHNKVLNTTTPSSTSTSSSPSSFSHKSHHPPSESSRERKSSNGGGSSRSEHRSDRDRGHNSGSAPRGRRGFKSNGDRDSHRNQNGDRHYHNDRHNRHQPSPVLNSGLVAPPNSRRREAENAQKAVNFNFNSTASFPPLPSASPTPGDQLPVATQNVAKNNDVAVSKTNNGPTTSNTTTPSDVVASPPTVASSGCLADVVKGTARKDKENVPALVSPPTSSSVKDSGDSHSEHRSGALKKSDAAVNDSRDAKGTHAQQLQENNTAVNGIVESKKSRDHVNEHKSKINGPSVAAKDAVNNAVCSTSATNDDCVDAPAATMWSKVVVKGTATVHKDDKSNK